MSWRSEGRVFQAYLMNSWSIVGLVINFQMQHPQIANRGQSLQSVTALCMLQSVHCVKNCPVFCHFRCALIAAVCWISDVVGKTKQQSRYYKIYRSRNSTDGQHGKMKYRPLKITDKDMEQFTVCQTKATEVLWFWYCSPRNISEQFSSWEIICDVYE